MLVNSAILIPVLRWTVPVSTLNGSAEIFNRRTRRGEQTALLPGPVVIVFRNCTELFTSSSLLLGKVLLPLLFRLRFYRRYFFGDASANFPRAINSSRVDAFAVSVDTRAQSSSLASFRAFGNGYFYCLFRIALTYFFRLALERYCSTRNIECKMGTFFFFCCSRVGSVTLLENREKLRNLSP